MQGNVSRDTSPELAVRRAAHRLGLRYRVSRRPLPDLPRTADMVFKSPRVAVFIDGCYWHGCPHHFKPPTTNSGYWKPKIERNIQRDADTNRRLRAAGWLALRFWEHEDPEYAAAAIYRHVRGKLSSASPKSRCAITLDDIPLRQTPSSAVPHTDAPRHG